MSLQILFDVSHIYYKEFTILDSGTINSILQSTTGKTALSQFLLLQMGHSVLILYAFGRSLCQLNITL